jgi:glycine/D-amino acid oxidase-like deaminating enzyme
VAIKALKGSHKARRIPLPSERSGWYELLPEAPPAVTVTGTQTFEFAVLGAGACGLAAARRLAQLRPEESIAVVEAARVGHGTSGRNAGFMLSHHSHGGIADISSGKRNDRLFCYGHAWLADIVQSHQIRCDWTEWGQIYVAADTPGEHHLGLVEQGFEALGVESARMERDELRAVTGTEFYSSGVRVAGASLVQPAAMMRGLGQTLPENVSVYENSPVEAIHADGGFRLICPDGEVHCRRLLLTNHVFAEELGFVRNRVVPVALAASLTRQLSDDERQLFDADQFGLLPASPNGSTVRLTVDGRILMRNTLGYPINKQLDAELLSRGANNHIESIVKRWPSLEGLELESTWGGILGFTRNEGTVFGEIAAGLYVALSTDASPMTRGTAAGKLLAESICGIASEELEMLRAAPKAAWLPPDPLLGFVARRKIRAMEIDEPTER